MTPALLVDRNGRGIAAPPREIIPLVTEGFDHRREPEASWRDQLAAISPPSDQVPYLWLTWLAGEPYEPVQRWAIWQVVPAPMLEHIIRQQQIASGEPDVPLAAILHDLRDISPRDPSKGRWVSDRMVPGGKRWRSNQLVSLQQWELWHELRGFATLFWIIQGEHGGHQRTYGKSDVERLRRMGLPVRPAAPGELSYAPFDGRVLEQMVRYDKLQQSTGDFTRRYQSQSTAIEVVDAERDAALAAIESENDAWLLEQVAGVVEHLSRQRIANIVEHLPVADDPGRSLSIRGGL